MNEKEKLILVIDDEQDILELVSIHLEKAGYKVKTFLEGESLLKFLQKNIPALLILDIMLPNQDGYEICKIIRKDERTASIPIIMLTAKGDELDKVLGLELGADDYITKPFSPRELVSRVKAVLRRIERKEISDKISISNNILIDLPKHKVFVDGEPVQLTLTEFKILKILAQKKGWVFSREKLLDYLWGDEKFVIDRTIDVHINNLRKKLGKYGDLIKNLRGIGYKLEE